MLFVGVQRFHVKPPRLLFRVEVVVVLDRADDVVGLPQVEGDQVHPDVEALADLALIAQELLLVDASDVHL